MNEKITFPRLASLLADRSGRSKRFSEDFLREFFALISERLEAGESVKVKGLGTFRLSRVEPRRSVDVTTGQPMEISGHSKVVFVPAKELAEAVNAPFEAFTAIEINDDVDISQLLSEDEIALKQETDDITEESTTITSDDSNAPTLPKAMTNSGNDKEESSEKNAESEDELHIDQTLDSEVNVGNEAQVETHSNVTEEETDSTEAEYEDSGTTDGEDGTSYNGQIDEEDEDIEEETDRKRGWLKILMISLCAAIVALFATLAVWYKYATDSFNTVFEKPLSYVSALKTAKGNDAAPAKEATFVLPDTTAVTEETGPDSLSSLVDEPEVPTAPSDAVVYDTIGNTRYLTTMAKSHYGNFNLWPYIYEENKSFLGHPDRIRPGTPVVIPKLSKYGVDPTNEEDIEKAKKLGIEIYARYGKKL